MKTFKQFQEDYTNVINPVKPVTNFIGAGLAAYELGKKAISGLSNIFQARKKRKIGSMEKRLHQREMGDRSNDMIKARRGEADKQNKLIDKYEKKYTSQQQKNTRRNIIRGLKGSNIQDEFSAPTNNASSGNIAGLPPDDPPVKKNKRGSGMKNRKKKKYAYGGRGSRKMWMT